MIPRRSAAVVGTVALMAAMAVPASAQPTIEVIADGLDNPRGVKVVEDGSIYVAEAGVGGETCQDPAEGGICYGPTGAIARVSGDGVERVVDGLNSSASGPEVGGVSDLAVGDDGSLYLIMNLGMDPAARADLPPEFAEAGWLVRVADDGTIEPVADVAAFESENDPDAEFGGHVDSNPYGIVATDAGVVVADAGGNDVLQVAPDGTTSLLGVIPPTILELTGEELAALGPPPEGEGELPPPDEAVPFPSEAVPTSVTVGPDGALYVGLLTGAPFPVGGASVWRLAEGEEPTEYATGFTNIMGLGFGPDGTLYAAEMVQGGLMSVFAGEDVPPFGAVVSVGPDGGEPQVVASGEQLMALGGLAVDAEGAIYVSTGTIMGPGGGALVKIVP
jgi:hypothetical protein